jgi:PKD repeat protein
VDQATGTAPFTANFDGSGSTDPSGGSLSYSWNWGDGSPAGNGANVSHTFSSVGNFSVALTVTNPSGKTGTTSKTVTTTAISCNITSGSFSNPSTNPTANDIKVVSGTPVNTSITFTATTNDACGSISAGLPYSDGSFLIAPMSVVSDVSGVKTWKTTTSSTKKFSTGLHQTGWVYDSVAGTSYSYQFSVHT